MLLPKREIFMPKLKKEYTDSRKKEIIWTAWKSFMEKGYEKTTMREIARRMDASTGILYNYFKSKEDILEEMEARFQEQIQRNYEEIRQKDTAREMLTELFDRRIRIHSHRGEKKQSRGRGGLLAEALRSERIRQVFNTRYKRIEKNIGEIIEIGIKNGEIASHVDPKTMAGMLHALLWGLRIQAVIVDHKDVESYRENLIEILLGNTWQDIKKERK
jgi:AcrR family transcriptional regulator